MNPNKKHGSTFIAGWIALICLSCVSADESTSGENPSSVSTSKANKNIALGKQSYAQCGVCHLPNGAGVPGAFPPLRSRIDLISSNDAGRQYLISVILDGLNGAISVGGVNYNGFMQSFADNLTNTQIAALLNYMGTELTESSDSQFKLFNEQEVASVRHKLKTATQSTRQLRKSIEPL